MNLNAVSIMWLRQIKRYARSRSRIVGSLGQPLLFLIALGFGFGPVYQRAGGGDYVQFLTPGVIAMGILFTAVFSGMEIIWDRRFGFLKETLAAPVSRFDIMLGRTLGGATVATIQGCIVFFLSLFVGFRPADIALLPIAFLLMPLIGLLFAAFGTVIACVIEDFQAFQLIMNFLVMPLFFLSGSLFPLEGLPKPLLLVARLDPLTYGIDGLRQTLSGTAHLGLRQDVLILSVITVLLLWIGSRLFARIEA